MVSTKKQLDDIKTRFAPLWIQINISKTDPTNAQTLALIKYAKKEGLRIETHAEGNIQDWIKLIKAGVNMLHTNQPAKIKAFLAQEN